MLSSYNINKYTYELATKNRIKLAES